MDIRLIGVVKDNSKKIIGYRLLDIDDKSVKDVPISNVMGVLKSAKIKIDGLKLKGTSLIGSNGSIDRYPVIVNGGIQGKSSLTIISQFTTDGVVLGYKVSDWKGALVNSSVADVIKYAKQYGISNGAVKTVGDKEIVSSIAGEYDKIVTQAKKEEPKKVVSEAEDLEKTIWVYKDFEKYMGDHGYKYTIEKTYSDNVNEIAFQCTEAKVIKYPMGVEEINSNFFRNNSSAELLILSPSIKEINFNILEKAPGIKKIVMQPGIGIIRTRGMDGYSDKVQLNEIKFPYTLKDITGGFSGATKLTELDFSNTALQGCRSCFNSLGGLTTLNFPSSLGRINRAFKGCMSLKSVNFPDSLVELYSCFSDSGLEVVDLSNCKDLKIIGYDSFRDCKNLREVKLPEGLEEISYGAFANCPNLKSVNMPKSLKTLGGLAFNGSLIDKFTVTNALESIGGNAFGDTVVIEFDESNTEVKPGFISEPGYTNIVLSDTIRKINRRAFDESINMKSIDIPTTVEVIGDFAFRLCAGLKDIDLSEANKLSRIGDSAFEDCATLSYMVLPEGLKEIGASCFKGCKNIQSMVLPKSLDNIGRGAFESIGKSTNLGTTFYVFEKSAGLRYCKKNNLKYIIVTCLEDVYRITNNVREIGQTKAAKLKLLLSSNELHRELLTSKYINYADLLHKMYNHMHSDIISSEYNNKLNRTKLISFPTNKVALVNNYLASKRYTVDNIPKEYIEEYTEDNLSMRFVTLANYITRIMDFNHTPFTTNGLKYLEDTASIDYKTLYIDNCSSIIVMEVRNPSLPSSTVRNIIAVITIGNNIVFVGAIDKDRFSRQYKILTRDKIFTKKAEASVADLLMPGDKLLMNRYYGPDYNSIQGAPLPKYIQSKAQASFMEHFIVLGHEDFSNLKVMNDSTNIIVDYLCLDSGKVITAQSVINDSGLRTITDVDDISSILVTDVKAFSDMSKDTEKRMLTGISSELTKRLFSFKSQEKEYKDNLSRLPGAFDTETSYEWDVAQLLNKIRVSNLQDMPISMFNLIVDTSFFAKTRRTLEDVKKLGRATIAASVEDGRYAIVEYKLRKQINSKKIPNSLGNYIIGMVDTQGNETDTQDFYVSNKSLDETINLISDIKESGAFPNRISNTPLDKDDLIRNFVIIQKQTITMYRDGYEYATMLGICKSNGSVYLLGVAYGRYNSIYTMLRFKTLDKALKHCTWMNAEDKHIPSKSNGPTRIKPMDEKLSIAKNHMLETLGNIHTGYNDFSSDNNVRVVREAVLKGLPNGHYIDCKDMELFDDVAKQEE